MPGWESTHHDPRQQQPQQAWPPREQPRPYGHRPPPPQPYGQWAPPPQQPTMGQLAQPPALYRPANYQPQQPQPAAQPPAKLPRRRGPYPSHLTRFPAELIPGSKRRRGPSIWRLVYLGTHPIAALISFIISLYVLMFLLGWIALVATGWAFWIAIVTISWACGGFQGTPRRR